MAEAVQKSHELMRERSVSRAYSASVCLTQQEVVDRSRVSPNRTCGGPLRLKADGIGEVEVSDGTAAVVVCSKIDATGVSDVRSPLEHYSVARVAFGVAERGIEEVPELSGSPFAGPPVTWLSSRHWMRITLRWQQQ